METKPITPSRRTRRVLLVLLTGADNLSGVPIARLVGSGAGGVYRIMSRLEQAGWVTGTWEHNADGTPRRKYYRLTQHGIESAIEMLGLRGNPCGLTSPGRGGGADDDRARPPA
jgi:PadR family transcriptional regulator, regulatory protein PadR